MGSVHGRAGSPVELKALPEAWGEGNKKKQISDTTMLTSSAKERVIKAEDIKIEPVDMVKGVETKENTLTEQKGKGSSNDSLHKTDEIECIEPPVPNEPATDVSITSRRAITTNSSPRPIKSDGTNSWNGSLESEGSDHLSVTSYNLIRTIRSSCRASKGLLDYSDMMFKDMLRKLELMHTNTRMRIMDELERVKDRQETQFTDITSELKELKQTVEKQNKLLEMQQVNSKSSKKRFTPQLASPQHLTEEEPYKDGLCTWSRAATNLVRSAVSHCAPSPTPKLSRIPLPTREGSRLFDRMKSANVGDNRDRPERQQQQAVGVGNSSMALMKQRYRAGTGTVRRGQQKQPIKAKEKEINIEEHKKGSKLARFR